MVHFWKRLRKVWIRVLRSMRWKYLICMKRNSILYLFSTSRGEEGTCILTRLLRNTGNSYVGQTGWYLFILSFGEDRRPCCWVILTSYLHPTSPIRIGPEKYTRKVCLRTKVWFVSRL